MADDSGKSTGPRRRVRLRRFSMSEAGDSTPPRLAADLERVFDTYDIQGFEYRTWDRWQASVPTGPGLRAQAHHAEDDMANTHRPTGPYAWEMPEDLKGGVLPLLRRMPDTSSLIAQLKLEGGPVVTALDESRDRGRALPELRDEAEEVPRKPAAPVAAPVVEPAPKQAQKASNDARSRLRQLALKGQTDG